MSCRMNRRIILQYQPGSVDDAGQPNGTWTDYRPCLARIVEGAGNEVRRGQQMEHAGGIKFEINHPKQGRFPSVEDRVTWSYGGVSRTANIKHVQRMGDGQRKLILHCTEVAS